MRVISSLVKMNHIKRIKYSSGLRLHLFEKTKCLQKSILLQNESLSKNYFVKSLEIDEQLNDKNGVQSIGESTKNSEELCLAESVLNDFKMNRIEQGYKKNIFSRITTKDGNMKIKKLVQGPGLNQFLGKPTPPVNTQIQSENVPYLPGNIRETTQKVYLEIYGCQMNVNDAEIISAILKKNNYEITKSMIEANIVLLITCSIRDSAEQKIWNKLHFLKHFKKKSNVSKIGLLGCMAERLKKKIIEEEKLVDIIAGPDSYKDLPRLLSMNNEHETAINVALSTDETYADVTPIRLNPDSKTAYVSIMRGCDNMCTYCIVPFTRGRERSRPITSILDEVKHLSDEGVKEITLLGQNVNSYRDVTESNFHVNSNRKTHLAHGFKTVYKNKEGGLRFSDLLDKVSLVNPEMRIRFTSPHPKDFPDEVLHLISERPNICKQIHLPAQSGSTEVLNRMRRGYSREAYINLVHHIRGIIPDIAFSSDFIAGFCDETEEEFSQTLSLIEEVKYSTAYLFAYSMREKTTAHRRYVDNVDRVVKHERLVKMIKLYRKEVEKIYRNQIGQRQLVLVEGESKRSVKDLQGRNDRNIKVIFPNESVPASKTSIQHEEIKKGDYIAVHVCNANSQILTGIPLYRSSISEFHSDENLHNKIRL